jgi:hypothetical protein
MTKTMSRWLGLACFGLILSSGPAHAVDLFKYGVGLQGVAGYNWNNPAPGSLLPELGGFRAGLGVSLDFRILGIVGIEADILRTSDRGSGTLEGAAKEFISVGQEAWHVPVLLKVAVPLPLIRPVVMGGVNFVVPGTCTVKGAETLDVCRVENYSSWTAGLGAELHIPIPLVDIRIPASLRYSQLMNRARNADASVARSEWQNDLYVTLGVSMYF